MTPFDGLRVTLAKSTKEAEAILVLRQFYSTRIVVPSKAKDLGILLFDFLENDNSDEPDVKVGRPTNSKNFLKIKPRL